MALAKRKRIRQWREADILFIDETSMINTDLFELLYFIGKIVRSDCYEQIFGGLCLILTGDLYQLHPVGNKKKKKNIILIIITNFDIVLNSMYGKNIL